MARANSLVIGFRATALDVLSASWARSAWVDQATAKQDNVINVMMPEATAQFIKSEQERYARIVKKADIKVE